MSEDIKVLLPKLGESIVSATIVQWFKKVGDPVNLDEPLLEVSTDKINSEIPSPAAGVLKEIHANPDQELQVGALIAVIAVGASTQEVAFAAAPVAAPAQAEESGQDMQDFSPQLCSASPAKRGSACKSSKKSRGQEKGDASPSKISKNTSKNGQNRARSLKFPARRSPPMSSA